jgi:hypothetical protein
LEKVEKVFETGKALIIAFGEREQIDSDTHKLFSLL